jgi:hypothetical protein
MWYDSLQSDGREGIVKSMPKKRKPTETATGHEQPYDSSFKALLDDQTLAMLSFFFGEEVLWAQELKESVFKRETVKPADARWIVPM